MKFTAALALAAAAGAAAQTTDQAQYGLGLLQALQSANLTALAGAAQNATSLISALTGSNKTVLAPSNEAFGALPPNLSPEILVATLSYHVLNGTIRQSNLTAGQNLIASSFLNSSQYVQLPNNRTQVAVLSKQSGNNTAYVVEAARNVSFASANDGPVYQNLQVHVINQVLQIPGNLSSVATAIGANGLAQALSGAQLLTPLQNSRTGLTIFAPNDAAFAAAASALQAASPEQARNVLLTHVINGTVAYSTQLTGSNAITSAVSASGNNLTFGSSNGSLTVTSGNATARIVRTDILASNAVIHVIDAVLANTASNPGAASSAFNSATSVAATQTGNAAATGTSRPNSAATIQIGAASLLGLVGAVALIAA